MGGIRVNCICPALVNTPTVGSFFREEFSKPTASRGLQMMAKQMMDPSMVVDAFMHVLADDALVAGVIVVSPLKTYRYTPKIETVFGPMMDPDVPSLVQSKL